MGKLFIVFALMFAASLSFAETVNFDKALVGSQPSGWTATQTGTGEAQWTIEKDDTAPSNSNVLKQSGEATFPICIKNDTLLKDGFVEVKFKPISGERDQAGPHLAGERFEQLLHRSCKCATRQRHYLRHCERAAHRKKTDEHESGRKPMAQFAS